MTVAPPRRVADARDAESRDGRFAVRGYRQPACRRPVTRRGCRVRRSENQGRLDRCTMPPDPVLGRIPGRRSPVSAFRPGGRGGGAVVPARARPRRPGSDASCRGLHRTRRSHLTSPDRWFVAPVDRLTQRHPSGRSTRRGTPMIFQRVIPRPPAPREDASTPTPSTRTPTTTSPGALDLQLGDAAARTTRRPAPRGEQRPADPAPSAKLRVGVQRGLPWFQTSAASRFLARGNRAASGAVLQLIPKAGRTDLRESR